MLANPALHRPGWERARKAFEDNVLVVKPSVQPHDAEALHLMEELARVPKGVGANGGRVILGYRTVSEASSEAAKRVSEIAHARAAAVPGRKKVRSDPRRRVGPGAAAAGGEPRPPLRNSRKPQNILVAPSAR
jgi:hypothetical protein